MADAFRPLSELLATDDVRKRIDEMKKEVRGAHIVHTETGIPFEDDFTMDFLLSTIFSSINGTGDVPEQRVQVMYLSQNQRLMIPQGLGMALTAEAHSEAAFNPSIVTAYWKIANRTFQELYEFAYKSGSKADKLKKVKEWSSTIPTGGMPKWMERGYFTVDPIDAGKEEASSSHIPSLDPESIASVFAIASRAVKLNFDVRDLGALVSGNAGMRLSDDAWKSVDAMSVSRLTSKLQPYTMSCIAGLNYSACKDYALGAWVRSFGVCCGILPAENTRLNKEWMYTSVGIADNTFKEIEKTSARYHKQLHPICLNILSIFGLMHLNKNHTFITGDTNMDRVGDAYINTLRTMVSTSLIDEMRGQKEVVVRTAGHPFGLGQTYCVAKLMHRVNALASPLALRITVTPPLTQRLMIVQAAVKEWKQMPIGPTMTGLFHEQLTAIGAAIDAIYTNPPAYSELHNLYGEDTFRNVPEDAKSAADAMMPIVYGYASAFHTDGETSKDGLALAMSFANVQRDYKAAATVYEQLWTKYLEDVEGDGLVKFVESAYKIGMTGYGTSQAGP